MLRRAVLVLAGFAGLAAALTACGGSGPADSASGGADSWAVIALSKTTGHLGTVNGNPDLAAAEADAVRVCNADDCRAVARVTHGCAALAQAPLRSWGRIDYAWGVGMAPTKADAARRAQADTQTPGAVVVKWLCTADHLGPP